MVLNVSPPFRLLLGTCKFVNRHLEHSVMKTHSWKQALEYMKSGKVGVISGIIGCEVVWVVFLHEQHSTPQVLLLLTPGHLVKMMVVPKIFGVFFE